MMSLARRLATDTVITLSERPWRIAAPGQRSLVAAALTLGAALVLLWSFLLAYGSYLLAHWMLS